jgi:Ca-activated chloride channel family protein
MEGNFYQSRNLPNEAIAAYLKASTYADAAPYAKLGLGVIYHALDEPDAALERFTEAALGDESGHTELQYRIHYNRGVILFENGKYAEAAADFRRALEADSRHIEAKRNLELSLLSQEQSENQSETSVEGKKQESARTETLFDYLREKEGKLWKSREWTGSAASDLDY